MTTNETTKEMLKHLDEAWRISSNLNRDYLEFLMDEVNEVPDDAEITVLAGPLKSLFRTCIAADAFIAQDFDRVRYYFESVYNQK